MSPIKLHNLKPADGSKKDRRRVGRGIGGKGGKTAGRGMKGQRARSKIKAGFEGGQMPMQRRLPKIGFRSTTAKESAEVLLYALDALEAGEITITSLREAGLVPTNTKKVKIVKKGEVTKAFTLKGVLATAGAKAAIEAAGGSISE